MRTPLFPFPRPAAAFAALLLLSTSACAPEDEPPDIAEAASPLSAPVVGPNTRVSDDATMAAQDQPTAATLLNHPGHLLIAAHSFPPDATAPFGGEAAFWRSTNSGRSFPTRGIVPGLTVAHGGIHQGASDLSLACSLSNDCYLASFVYDTPLHRTGIAVSHSPDGGASWDAPTIVISEDDPGLFNERCSIAVDNSPGPRRGAVYVSWIRVELAPNGSATEVPIWLASSTNQGKTFSAPRQISDSAVNLLNNKPVTLVDAAGRVFVFYENYLLNDPERDQHVVQRADDGVNFGQATQVTFVFDAFTPLPPAHFRDNSFPQAAADPITGRLYVAWTDMRFGSPDILLTTSIDQGATWSPPARVNDTPEAAPIQHALPAVACGPLGVCGASFYSSRNDPGGLLLDTYFVPFVAGHVVGSNIRASFAPMNPNVQFGGRFIGDYTALVIGWTEAHPVWTDSRVVSPDPQQDIFTARITASP